MDSTGQALLNLLFNPDEGVCVSNCKFGFHSVPLDSALGNKNNEVVLDSPDPGTPIRICNSSDLILVAMNPIRGYRRDSNVTNFRTFLVELDFGSTQEQLGTIEYFKMPFSAQVFSGNKSVHTIITLDEDLPDEQTWREIAEWILGIMNMADKNCKNPSRSVRIPGAYREPNKKQELIKLNRRISHKELFGWLNQYDNLRPRVREKQPVLTGEGSYDKLSPWAQNQIKYGIKITKGRNQTWYGLFCDFYLAGYSKDEAINALEPLFIEERDFKKKEWEIIANSAFKEK